MNDPSRVQPSESTNAARAMSYLRLYSGLIIFIYCLFHFANHAVGILLVDRMEELRRTLMWVWHRDVFKWSLYAALLVHPAVSLAAIYQRRHLRMPAAELTQLLSGVLVPVLIAQHIASVVLADQLLGTRSHYHRILLELWVEQPWRAVQFSVLLLIVWAHGCLGIHYWLRLRSWYSARVQYLIVFAVAMPALALAGFIASGIYLARSISSGAQNAQAILERSKASQPLLSDFVGRWEIILIALYLLVVGFVFTARWYRDVRARKTSPVRVRYLDGSEVIALPGLTLLEVSRWAGVPHQSKCGGRGRCSTCRVRILAGLQDLAPPDTLEMDTLRRIGAASNVRLACQLRPTGAVVVQPLMPVDGQRPQPPELDGLAFGQEINVVIISVDLRASTKLCAEKLPYDALFIVERYLGVVVASVRENDGHVVSIAGDGVMALFGLAGGLQKACRDALNATDAIWAGMDRLNDELATELPWPLKFGVGIHAGECVVGITTVNANASVQFLGNTGNIASRLENATKQLNCSAVISEHAATVAGLDKSAGSRHSIDLAGWPEPMFVVAIDSRAALAEALSDLVLSGRVERG